MQGQPLNGAQVRIEGASPPITTTTDQNGAFSLQVPAADHFLVAEATAHWATLELIRVPAAGLPNVSIEPIPDADVAMVASSLQRTIDPAKGIVVVLLEFAQGGESATINGGNGGNGDPPFTFDQNGTVVESNTVLASSDPVLVYTNVEPGTITVSVIGNGTTSCTLEYQGVAWTVLARTATTILATCQ